MDDLAGDQTGFVDREIESPPPPSRDSKTSLSVVIPVYNSRDGLRKLVSTLDEALTSFASEFEVILVNDGSSDDSWLVICDLADQYEYIKGIDLFRNYGQHNALLAGIREARLPIIVTMDDDLQNPPDEIPRLIEPLGQGFDIVYGVPIEEHADLGRRLASRLIRIALRSASGAKMTRDVSSFRAFRADLTKAFANFRGPFAPIDVLLAWGTTNAVGIPVRHHNRADGSSNYTLGKLIRLAIDMMTGFSTLPLQLASVVGFMFTAFGFVVLVYVVVQYLIEGGGVPGFPFLASIIAIFSGAQLFALGINGEYLARMHFRMMDRPTYLVRETTREKFT